MTELQFLKPCKVVDVNGRNDVCPRAKNRHAAKLSEPSCLGESEQVRLQNVIMNSY